ncbi:MAG: hypothetical protein M5Z89_01660 [Olivibacter sp.]|nr:hypothetical protein [Olivibacter sp. UJ_SKK_5.1]
MSQERPSDSSVQISAAKVVVHADYPEDGAPNYCVKAANRHDASGIVTTYDEKAKYVILEGEKKGEEIEVTFSKNSEQDK